jgi:hypothetical protein
MNTTYEEMFVVEDDEELTTIYTLEEKLSNFHIEKKENYKYILSIDIGINHLGISYFEIYEDYTIKEILWIDLINITEFTCNRAKCPFYHDKTITDWLCHVFEMNRGFFENSDHILIERQPPVGLVAVEQIIFAAYRDKAILISPNSVHKHFNMSKYDYEGRKNVSERIALYYLDKFYDFKEQYYFYNRRHDISDSILFVVYWCNKKNKELINQKIEKDRKERFAKMSIRLKSGEKVNACELLEQFRYSPKVV